MTNFSNVSVVKNIDSNSRYAQIFNYRSVSDQQCVTDQFQNTALINSTDDIASPTFKVNETSTIADLQGYSGTNYAAFVQNLRDLGRPEITVNQALKTKIFFDYYQATQKPDDGSIQTHFRSLNQCKSLNKAVQDVFKVGYRSPQCHGNPCQGNFSNDVENILSSTTLSTIATHTGQDIKDYNNFSIFIFSNFEHHDAYDMLLGRIIYDISTISDASVSKDDLYQEIRDVSNCSDYSKAKCLTNHSISNFKDKTYLDQNYAALTDLNNNYLNKTDIESNYLNKEIASKDYVSNKAFEPLVGIVLSIEGISVLLILGLIIYHCCKYSRVQENYKNLDEKFNALTKEVNSNTEKVNSNTTLVNNNTTTVNENTARINKLTDKIDDYRDAITIIEAENKTLLATTTQSLNRKPSMKDLYHSVQNQKSAEEIQETGAQNLKKIQEAFRTIKRLKREFQSTLSEKFKTEASSLLQKNEEIVNPVLGVTRSIKPGMIDNLISPDLYKNDFSALNRSKQMITGVYDNLSDILGEENGLVDSVKLNKLLFSSTTDTTINQNIQYMKILHSPNFQSDVDEENSSTIRLEIPSTDTEVLDFVKTSIQNVSKNIAIRDEIDNHINKDTHSNIESNIDINHQYKTNKTDNSIHEFNTQNINSIEYKIENALDDTPKSHRNSISINDINNFDTTEKDHHSTLDNQNESDNKRNYIEINPMSEEQVTYSDLKEKYISNESDACWTLSIDLQNIEEYKRPRTIEKIFQAIFDPGNKNNALYNHLIETLVEKKENV